LANLYQIKPFDTKLKTFDFEGNEVSIHYQGACGSCPTSTSGTLQYIQTQIRQQLHPKLTVKSV